MADSPQQRRLKALEQALMTTKLYSRGKGEISEPEAGGSETLDFDSLEGLELIYHFCKSVFKDVIGDPKSAFAVFDESSGGIKVFSKDAQFVSIEESPWLQAMYGALEALQIDGTSFHYSDGQVTCVSNGVTGRGRNYGEAAMRTFLSRQELMRPPSSCPAEGC